MIVSIPQRLMSLRIAARHASPPSGHADIPASSPSSALAIGPGDAP